jgi:hypothetical protein
MIRSIEKNAMTLSGIEPMTFELVAQCLNQLHYRRAIVQVKGLGHLKNPMASSGIEPTTFQLVA